MSLDSAKMYSLKDKIKDKAVEKTEVKLKPKPKKVKGLKIKSRKK